MIDLVSRRRFAGCHAAPCRGADRQGNAHRQLEKRFQHEKRINALYVAFAATAFLAFTFGLIG